MDRKTSRDKPAEFYRVEATSHLTTELDKEFEINYPMAEKHKVDLWEKIGSGEIPFFSFDTSNKDKEFLRKAIITALSRATNPDDYSFSVHGDQGHTTYQEAISKVIESIQAGTVILQHTYFVSEIDSGRGKMEVPMSRLVLDSPPYERKTGRPYAHDFSLALARDPRFREESGRKKMLRKVALEQGVGFAILVEFYSGDSINNSLDFFEDPNFKRNLYTNFGNKAKIPSRARGTDIKMLSEIATLLTVPTSSGRKASPNAENYKNALSLLINQNYLDPKKIGSYPFSFVEVKDTVQARVVLKGGTEAAQKLAPPELVPPVRVDYIDKKYGNIVTSEVITAFLANS